MLTWIAFLTKVFIILNTTALPYNQIVNVLFNSFLLTFEVPTSRHFQSVKTLGIRNAMWDTCG